MSSQHSSPARKGPGLEQMAEEVGVPLTMMLKIALENTEDFRWVAVMLDKDPPSVPSMSRQSGDVGVGT